MYGYVYLTTNLTNNKKYIGRKKSEKFLGNSYIGSGIDLKKDIKLNNLNKYKDFEVKILEICNSEYELSNREIYWISFYDAVKSNEFYNKHPGGYYRGSGWYHTDNYRKLMSEMQSNGKSWMCGKHHSESTKKKMSDARKGEKHPFYGKHHTEESKSKMRQRKLENLPKQCGCKEDNPMYGKIWITDGNISKVISKDELSAYESIGFRKGRVISKKD